MANAEQAAGQPSANWPTVKTGPLVAGGVLIGVGALVALAGLVVAGTHIANATRDWVKDLDTPPSELARLKWEQAKSAMNAGAATWQDHPNAQVHLARRNSSAAS